MSHAQLMRKRAQCTVAPGHVRLASLHQHCCLAEVCLPARRSERRGTTPLHRTPPALKAALMKSASDPRQRRQAAHGKVFGLIGDPVLRKHSVLHVHLGVQRCARRGQGGGTSSAVLAVLSCLQVPLSSAVDSPTARSTASTEINRRVSAMMVSGSRIMADHPCRRRVLDSVCSVVESGGENVHFIPHSVAIPLGSSHERLLRSRPARIFHRLEGNKPTGRHATARTAPSRSFADASCVLNPLCSRRMMRIHRSGHGSTHLECVGPKVDNTRTCLGDHANQAGRHALRQTRYPAALGAAPRVDNNAGYAFPRADPKALQSAGDARDSVALRARSRQAGLAAPREVVVHRNLCQTSTDAARDAAHHARRSGHSAAHEGGCALGESATERQRRSGESAGRQRNEHVDSVTKVGEQAHGVAEDVHGAEHLADGARPR
jgi:hypothetical protein